MKRKIEDADTSVLSPREVSLCIRAITNNPDKMVWYMYNNISCGVNTTSTPQPCYKDNLKKMNKEAKKRMNAGKKKLQERNLRKFKGLVVEEEEDDEVSPLTPICCTPKIPDCSCWTLLESSIFCLGSRKSCKFGLCSNKVRICSEFLELEKRWKSGPPMINGRYRCKAVTEGDKIYVFGGTELDSGPWGEVFTKHDETWMALKEPPFKLQGSLTNIFASLYTESDHTKIVVVVCGTRGLYAYCPAMDSWETLNEMFRLKGPCFTEPVVVDMTMYWVGDETIWGYDLRSKIFLSGRIHFWGLKEALFTAMYFRSPLSLQLLHLDGDEFLLVWRGVDVNHDRPRSVFVLHKFRILKRLHQTEEQSSLKVLALSTEYLLTAYMFSSFSAVLTLEPKEAGQCQTRKKRPKSKKKKKKMTM